MDCPHCRSLDNNPQDRGYQSNGFFFFFWEKTLLVKFGWQNKIVGKTAGNQWVHPKTRIWQGLGNAQL